MFDMLDLAEVAEHNHGGSEIEILEGPEPAKRRLVHFDEHTVVKTPSRTTTRRDRWDVAGEGDVLPKGL
jgi:hypothetical protein